MYCRVILITLILATGVFDVFGQQQPDFVCQLYNVDLPRGSTENTINRNPFKKFGEYKNYGSMEEERITKYFKVPKTRWYAVVSMFTSDESLPERGSLDWELSFSRTRRRNILTSPAYAASESTFNTFDINRVSTIVTLDGRRMLVILQCAAPNNKTP